jgi:hypothetical protein
MSGYSSTLYPGEVIIDRSTGMSNKIVSGRDFPGEGKYGRGLNLKLKGPFGYGAVAVKLPRELYIPKGEWKDRIEEMEGNKSRLSDLINQAELPCKNQAQTNYCWINAPTHCVEINRVVQNQQMVILSPASVGGPLTGFKNVGGWGGPGLNGIALRGLCPVEKWPANAIDSKYWTDDNKALALHYRQTEWFETDDRDIDAVISLLLRRIPVALGYNWWSHEVTGVDAVWVNGKIGIRIRNSWSMDWPTAGAGGYSVLQDNKMVPDDAVAPTSIIAA